MTLAAVGWMMRNDAARDSPTKSAHSTSFARAVPQAESLPNRHEVSIDQFEFVRLHQLREHVADRVLSRAQLIHTSRDQLRRAERGRTPTRLLASADG